MDRSGFMFVAASGNDLEAAAFCGEPGSSFYSWIPTYCTDMTLVMRTLCLSQ